MIKKNSLLLYILVLLFYMPINCKETNKVHKIEAYASMTVGVGFIALGIAHLFTPIFRDMPKDAFKAWHQFPEVAACVYFGIKFLRRGKRELDEINAMRKTNE